MDSAAASLVDEAGEDLSADTCTANTLGDDHLRHKRVKGSIADQPTDPDQKPCIISSGADDPAPGQSPFETL